MSPRIKKLSLLLLFLTIAGCGYHLVGTGTTLPPHLKTIAIPVFKNQSTQPNIHRDITNAIRQSFVNDGRLKVVKTHEADLVMKGIFSTYNLQAVSFTADDVAREYWVQLGGSVDIFDRVKKKRFLKQDYNTKWDFQSDDDVINSESARQLALTDAYRILGNRLVSIVVDQF